MVSRTGGAPAAVPADAVNPADDRAWRELLRSERLRLGLSQVQVGALVGVSPETIRKYESGGRTPGHSRLVRIVSALQLSQRQSRAILRGAGFAPADTLFPAEGYPDYYFTVPQLRAAVEQVPWPQFVTNDLAEVVAANRAAQVLWGIDLAAELARRSRAQLNLLAVAAERHFAERVANWSECLTILAGIFKGRPREPIVLEDPGAFFAEVLEAYVTNDPGAIPQLVAAWESTPPQAAKVRWSYPLRWREPGISEIAFLALVSVASEPDGLWFNDWIPVDVMSHGRLDAVVGVMRASAGAGAAQPDQRSTGRDAASSIAHGGQR
jgi:transcriptional regulator with XRE-family HTH domain